MKCAQCGEFLAESVEWCPSCSASVRGRVMPSLPGIPGREPSRESERRPTGVIVVTTLFVINGLLGIVFGVIVLNAAKTITQMVQTATEGAATNQVPRETLNEVITKIVQVVAYIIMGVGGINLLIAWGLYGMKAWARM